MKIGVIGANGVIGREIYNHLPDTKRCMVTQTHWNDSNYNIIIDANGSSMKYLAQTNPKRDFDSSVLSVIDRVHNLNYGKYIYISSIDAEEPGKNNYGFHRKLAERIVKHYCPNFIIIRLCAVIGENMTKGIVHDILLGEKIFVTKDTRIQVISVQEVAEKVIAVMNKRNNNIFRFYSKGSIEVSEICDMFGRNPVVVPNAEMNTYNFQPSDCGFKTPEEYLKETFYERMVKPMESV
jgi:dTDP-4-dehydrorhamnose reductase